LRMRFHRRTKRRTWVPHVCFMLWQFFYQNSLYRELSKRTLRPTSLIIADGSIVDVGPSVTCVPGWLASLNAISRHWFVRATLFFEDAVWLVTCLSLENEPDSLYPSSFRLLAYLFCIGLPSHLLTRSCVSRRPVLSPDFIPR
jgi:hypothetical protein